MNQDKQQPSTEALGTVGLAPETARGAEVPVERRPKPRHPIAGAVGGYLQTMRGIGATAQTVLPHTAKWLLSEREKLEKKLQKYIPGFPNIEEDNKFEIGAAREFAEFIEALKSYQDIQSNNAPAILSRALFMQMFSEFDAFTGYLLKAIYLRNDALLKGISREISLCDLLEHADLNSVKRAMLEKEIDSFRRDSYVEQFASLEKKFSIALRKFPEWGEFVELSQRRNIFTHNGGVVNDQYLLVCEREGYQFPQRPSIGDRLTVSFEYFARALRLLSKVALMLGYTLWAKVFPKELDELQQSLNGTIYTCLEQKRWHFVSNIQDFVLSESMRKGLTEIDLRIRIVNVSIGLKFSGRDGESLKLLHSVDWTASYRDFKLAIAVLSEKYDDAAALMHSIGKSGEIIDQESYHTWPLFTKFREQPIFFQTYEEVYGESFMEQVRREVDSVAERSVHSANAKQPRQPDQRVIVDVDARELSDSEETTKTKHAANRAARVPRAKRE
jgi:hypothetical protein